MRLPCVSGSGAAGGNKWPELFPIEDRSVFLEPK